MSEFIGIFAAITSILGAIFSGFYARKNFLLHEYKDIRVKINNIHFELIKRKSHFHECSIYSDEIFKPQSNSELDSLNEDLAILKEHPKLKSKLANVNYVFENNVNISFAQDEINLLEKLDFCNEKLLK